MARPLRIEYPGAIYHVKFKPAPPDVIATLLRDADNVIPF